MRLLKSIDGRGGKEGRKEGGNVGCTMELDDDYLYVEGRSETPAASMQATLARRGLSLLSWFGRCSARIGINLVVHLS